MAEASPTAKDFKVAIVGAGLCGLATAVALSRAGISVTVFEASRKFEEVGAGVGLGPNAVRALKGLGIFDAVLARSDKPGPYPRLFRFVSAYNPHELIYDYETSSEDNLGLAIYRPAFLDAVTALLDPSITHFEKRCTFITVTGSGMNVVHFADGTSHQADLVIGADGIRSVTRHYVVDDSLTNPLVFTNTVAYRGLIPVDDLRKAGMKTDLWHRPVNFVGTGKHIIAFPIKGDTVINFVIFFADHDKPMAPELPSPWVQSVSEELKDSYESWGDDPKIILDLLENRTKWSIHAIDPPLETYFRDKVVLVGDSAHAMLPHLGAGVGQGFEDVFVLVRLLAHPQAQKKNLHDILMQYDKVRCPRANAVLEGSRRAGELWDAYRSEQDSSSLKARLIGHWEWVWNHDLDQDVAVALKALYETHAFEVSRSLREVT